MNRKFTAIALCMIMICQLFSFAAFAENTTTSPIDTPITKTELETLLVQTVDGGHPYLMGRKSDLTECGNMLSAVMLS